MVFSSRMFVVHEEVGDGGPIVKGKMNNIAGSWSALWLLSLN